MPALRLDGRGWRALSVDGEGVERRANIIEDAVESAVSPSAELLPLHDRPELGRLGGIAAVPRF